MKKSVSIILCLVMVLGLACTLAACGDGSVAGRYDMVSMEMGGTVIDIDTLEAMSGSKVEMYIQLNEDGTGVLCSMGETVDMEWADGQMWPVDDPDDKVAFEVDGDTLTMEQEGAKMVFEK